MKNPNDIGVIVPPEKVVQSASVGDTARPRKKKAREIQGLKKQQSLSHSGSLKDVVQYHMEKLKNNLRP